MALAAIVVVAIVLAHVLRLERASPATAATLWAGALGLRALAGVFTALYVVLFMPATQLFDALTHWCWHTIVPLATTHLGFSGHRVGDAMTTVPSMLLAASAVSIGFGIWRASRAVHRLLTHAALGDGPAGSVIIGGADVVVAAAGLARPRLVVSAGALANLDDEELAASLDHENGHIERRHRYVLLYAEVCRALGRFLPGTSSAVRALRFQLERDADCWALRRPHDRFALASAICKAAVPRGGHGPALAALGGGDVVRRVDELVAGRPPLSRSQTGALNALAAIGVTLVIALSAAVPLAVAAGSQRVGQSQAVHPCTG
ncbi:MAG: M56 family metallopeptidase [Solirubrobacterales bacterium]|nr:M56 family metallopeptidase [Solirubrobacterales bacterium]